MQRDVSSYMDGRSGDRPRLREPFLGGNGAWARWLLWRMDEHVEWRGAVEAPDLARKPSEYFRRQCWVSVECDETPAVHAAETLADNIVFSTDYPQDRKSTRLNSSHGYISYAVFCLKKKKTRNSSRSR